MSQPAKTDERTPQPTDIFFNETPTVKLQALLDQINAGGTSNGKLEKPLTIDDLFVIDDDSHLPKVLWIKDPAKQGLRWIEDPETKIFKPDPNQAAWRTNIPGNAGTILIDNIDNGEKLILFEGAEPGTFGVVYYTDRAGTLAKFTTMVVDSSRIVRFCVGELRPKDRMERRLNPDLYKAGGTITAQQARRHGFMFATIKNKQ